MTYTAMQRTQKTVALYVSKSADWSIVPIPHDVVPPQYRRVGMSFFDANGRLMCTLRVALPQVVRHANRRLWRSFFERTTNNNAENPRFLNEYHILNKAL